MHMSKKIECNVLFALTMSVSSCVVAPTAQRQIVFVHRIHRIFGACLLCTCSQQVTSMFLLQMTNIYTYFCLSCKFYLYNVLTVIFCVMQRAKEQAKQKKEAEIMFQMGQRAYARGVYDKSVEILEAALTKIPRASNLGGEVNLSYLPT